MNLTTTSLRVASVAVLGAGLTFATLAPAAAPASAAPTSAGNLIYVSSTGAIELVGVDSAGGTSSPHQIGPLSTVTSGQQLSVEDLTASADGTFAAWTEEVTTSSDQPPVSNLLVVRNNNTGQEYTKSSDDEPVGFAGHSLIVSSGVEAYRVVLTPTVHLVSLHDPDKFYLAGYKHGLIDDRSSAPMGSAKKTVLNYDHVRLKPFSGKARTLHTFTEPQNTVRNLEQGAASGDSKHLLLEFGDHTDFGGNGPSSIVDEQALTGSKKLTHLGHYGTAKAQWRVWDFTYVGSKDAAWVTWYRVHSQGVTSVVTKYAGGHWQLVLSHAVTAVGNPKGYVVVQPGKFAVVANTQANQHVPTPSADAILVHPGHQHALSIEGSSFVWVSKDVVPN